ncbi:hypothetical protein [Bradyrhizobium erythrophlei]|uniref:Phage integrase family protein n=1 Tax=Bradyrhizobium erythrophlei TaxID=1437360 RepID=A0A1H4NJ01_9BRAD|nr:hypothetical protein [Bradyrhizobium erythrophlei]SEB95207.1 hypothetical protein SAMN05444164_0645 [Bradyrhizobium erythrophlei]
MALPEHVHSISKPNGRTYYYYSKFRRTGREWPRVRITAEPLSEEFAKRVIQLDKLDAVSAEGAWSWFFTDVTGRRHPLPAPADHRSFWEAVDKAEAIGIRVQAGNTRSFRALIAEFKKHRAYTEDIAEGTREQYDRYIEMIEVAWGDDPVETLEATTIQGVLDKGFADTPSAGRVFRSTLSRIISWGIPRGFRKDNPVEHTERYDSEGTYSPWPPEAFDVFFEHARVDLHLAVYSGLFTGQRKVDVINMLRPKSTDTGIPLIAQKTQDRIPVQIHSEYRGLIDAAPTDKDKPQLRLHLRADGEPWSYEGFKTAWGRALDKKPMAMFREKRLVFHGLRKNAVNMLLEVGCTEEEVSAIVGMSAQMVHHYSKEVSKFRMAKRAMQILESRWSEQRVHVLGAKKKEV